MNPPFATLPPGRRSRWLIGALVLTVVVQAGLMVSGAPLRTEAARAGIVSFEFAGDRAGADAILASWAQNEATGHAAFNLGLDYAFLLAYATALALACLAVAETLDLYHAAIARLGRWLAWAAFGAAGLDAVENTALIQVVLGARSDALLLVAWGCALVKFVLVGMGVAYVVLGLSYRFFRR